LGFAGERQGALAVELHQGQGNELRSIGHVKFILRSRTSLPPGRIHGQRHDAARRMSRKT
jgi:hypothetical protein